MAKLKEEASASVTPAPAAGSNGDHELPRTWLVQAYLCGYEPPSLALSVPLLDEGEGLSRDFLSLQGVQPPYQVRGGQGQAGASNDSGIHDIDEEGNSPSPSSAVQEDGHLEVLPMPPLAFLEAPVMSEHEEGDTVKVTGRSLDRKAFRLLRHLVTLLERSMGEGEGQGAPSST